MTEASICVTISIVRSHLNITHLSTLTIENLRLFGCVTDFLKDGRLARIGSSNDEDAEAAAPLSD